MLPNLVKRKPSQSIYTPEDTIIQYYEHFNTIRNMGGQQQQQQQPQRMQQ
jgi:hypothetical protein